MLDPGELAAGREKEQNWWKSIRVISFSQKLTSIELLRGIKCHFVREQLNESIERGWGRTSFGARERSKQPWRMRQWEQRTSVSTESVSVDGFSSSRSYLRSANASTSLISIASSKDLKITVPSFLFIDRKSIRFIDILLHPPTMPNSRQESTEKKVFSDAINFQSILLYSFDSSSLTCRHRLNESANDTTLTLISVDKSWRTTAIFGEGRKSTQISD